MHNHTRVNMKNSLILNPSVDFSNENITRVINNVIINIEGNIIVVSKLHLIQLRPEFNLYIYELTNPANNPIIQKESHIWGYRYFVYASDLPTSAVLPNGCQNIDELKEKLKRAKKEYDGSNLWF